MNKKIKLFLVSMLMALALGGCVGLPKECINTCKKEYLECESEAKRTHELCMLGVTNEQNQRICEDSLVDSRFWCNSTQSICRSNCL
jgi:hypothetical protein